MFVHEITEFRVQIEINDDAARLRLRHTKIKCLQVTSSEIIRCDLCKHESENACLDCGDCIICCRCCPGEG